MRGQKPSRRKASSAVKPFVFIIECMEKDDPGSEGRFVKHMLDLMQIPNCYRKAKDQAEFIEVLSTFSPEADVVHISTHGEYEETRSKRHRFTGFATPCRAVTIDAIRFAGINLLASTWWERRCCPRPAFPARRPRGKRSKMRQAASTIWPLSKARVFITPH
jgi:hypothetical protein